MPGSASNVNSHSSRVDSPAGGGYNSAAMSTLGRRFRVTLFGESHGPGVGAVIEGIPAGLALDLASIRAELDRRRPGTSKLASPRKETDEPEFQSGVVKGVATGAAVTVWIPNVDVDSKPYEAQGRMPRPGHADLTAWLKWGEAADFRGGGPFSARTTAPLVIAGAIARQLIPGISIAAHTVEIAGVRLAREATMSEIVKARGNPAQCADPETGTRMEAAIAEARSGRDSVGGVVECRAEGVPGGLGGPGLDGLESELSRALFAIPAVRGVEFGAGFSAARMRGSQHNDPFYVDESRRIRSRTNHAGGILGGISTGMPIVSRVAFKPVASIPRPQETVNLATLEPATLTVKGRHDTCVVPRAVPIVEAVTACVLADHVLEAALQARAGPPK